MKTVWIIDHYSSEPQFGGIARQFDFANELSKRGYNVVVISSSFSHFTHNYFKEEEISISRVNDNVHYVYLKTTAYTKNSGLARLKNMLSFKNMVVEYMDRISDMLGKPDVVNGCSVHPFAWIAANTVSKKYKTKLCVEVRDLWPEVWVLSGEKSKYHPMVVFFGALEKWAYKKADRIIYSMSKGQNYFRDKHGISEEKMFLIGQPMDCTRFDENAINNYSLIPQEIRGFIQDSFVCVFAGYYMTYEGIYTMLEAAKILKEKNLPIKMVFVGSGQEKEGMEIYTQENKLDNVYIGDRINKNAIPALLKSSNICMAHLAIEGHKDAYKYGVSKNKVNEYLYSGACTLYGFTDENDAVQTSNAGFIFEPFNSEDLASRIAEIYHMDENKQKTYGENGRNYVTNFHSKEVLTNRLESVFFEW